MQAKNVVQKCPKSFGVQKLSNIFTTHCIWRVFPACKIFSDCHWCTDKCTLQYRSLLCAPYAHRVEKCGKFAITNGGSKTCPRKYWRTDRGPNRIWSFSEVQFFILIYNSGIDLKEFNLPWAICQTRVGAWKEQVQVKLKTDITWFN